MQRALSLCLVIASFALPAAAQNQDQKPANAKERQRVVSIARKMEEKPLDPGQLSERQWALQWVIEVPDIHVDLCKEVLGDFTSSEYKYRSLLTVQLTLSSAAFLIQHPEKTDDQVAEFTAGVESVLRAYKAILRSHPHDTSPDLDDLMDKQNHGQLTDFIREAAEDCDSDSDPSDDRLRGIHSDYATTRQGKMGLL